MTSFAVNSIVASGDLIQQFEATWDDEQEKSTFKLRSSATMPMTSRFELHLFVEIKARTKVVETAAQARTAKHLTDNSMTTYRSPIVGVGLVTAATRAHFLAPAPRNRDSRFNRIPSAHRPVGEDGPRRIRLRGLCTCCVCRKTAYQSST